MWKPFLARSLRSVFGGRRHAVPPGGADRIFSRGYTAGGGEGTSRPQRRHLYVVLRDCKRKQDVYTFHKLNLDGALEDMNGGVSEGAQNLRRLPEPILRLGSSGIGTHASMHALGSNIVITGGGHHSHGLTLVYSTDTGELDIRQDLPLELFWPYDAVAAGGKLHALQAPHYLWEALPEHWTWASGGRSPIPRFDGDVGASIRAHAVHPDGRTVFVSVKHFNQGQAQHDTFSLDTESGEWRHRGNWHLPFHGRGHYDADLEAWVGIAPSADGRPPCDYYLCSCDVPDLAGGSVPPPAWKLDEEKLTFIETPLSATGHAPGLVHTGHGRFCFVETASLERAAHGRRCSCDAASANEHSSIQLRVTMFRTKYGKNGELGIAAAPRAARTYGISSSSSFAGPAFWM